MSLVGGIGTFVGPGIGSAIYLLVHNIITSITEYWMLIFGSILVAIVVVFPGGITGYLGPRVRRLFMMR